MCGLPECVSVTPITGSTRSQFGPSSVPVRSLPGPSPDFNPVSARSRPEPCSVPIRSLPGPSSVPVPVPIPIRSQLGPSPSPTRFLSSPSSGQAPLPGWGAAAPCRKDLAPRGHACGVSPVLSPALCSAHASAADTSVTRLLSGLTAGHPRGYAVRGVAARRQRSVQPSAVGAHRQLWGAWAAEVGPSEPRCCEVPTALGRRRRLNAVGLHSHSVQ